MKHSLFVGLYWGSRKESISECSIRLSKFLIHLKELPLFDQWYPKNKITKKLLYLDSKLLSEHFKQNKKDIGGDPISELGFNINFWNGNDELPISLSMTIGAYSKIITNSVVIQFSSLEIPSDIITETELENILLMAIDTWDPSHAVITSHEHLKRQGGGLPWEKQGWFYYSKEDGKVRKHQFR